MDLKEFKATDFASTRKKLISRKGSNEQREFLEAARKKDTFIEWVISNIPFSEVGSKELSVYPEKLTENEFKDTTRYVERTAFNKWKELTPSLACRSSFWGAVTLNHIKCEVIEPPFLAAGNSSGQSGLSRIEQALRSNDSKLTDDVSRTILRRFSGLPEARGGLRSIYVNCTFGRAWWREKIISEVVSLTGGNEDKIAQTLRISQEYWEKLVNLLSTSNSVFGDEKIRTNFIWALSDHINNPDHSKLFRSKGSIDKCMQTLGIYSACQEFGVYENNELKQFMEKEVILPFLEQ